MGATYYTLDSCKTFKESITRLRQQHYIFDTILYALFSELIMYVCIVLIFYAKKCRHVLYTFHDFSILNLKVLLKKINNFYSFSFLFLTLLLYNTITWLDPVCLSFLNVDIFTYGCHMTLLIMVVYIIPPLYCNNGHHDINHNNSYLPSTHSGHNIMDKLHLSDIPPHWHFMLVYIHITCTLYIALIQLIPNTYCLLSCHPN